MKKNSMLLIEMFVAFTGIHAEQHPKQENQSYFENFKDALASSDEAEIIPISENQEKKIFRVNQNHVIKDSKNQ